MTVFSMCSFTFLLMPGIFMRSFTRLLLSLGNTSFLTIFSTMRGTEMMTSGRISMKASWITVGLGKRVRKKRWFPKTNWSRNSHTNPYM